MINRVIVAGQVSSYGPKIEWTPAGKPQTSLTLVLQKGEFRTFCPVLIVGAKAEDVCETINGGDTLLIEGSLSWKAGRSKDAGKLQVVAFDVTRLLAAAVESAN
jgi:primosomal replication protein N